MADQSQDTLGQTLVEAIEICVNELGLKMPLQTVTIDMGSHVVTALIHEDGRIAPIIDPGRGVTTPLYPVHTLIVDRDGNSATLVVRQKDKPMRTLH